MEEQCGLAVACCSCGLYFGIGYFFDQAGKLKGLCIAVCAQDVLDRHWFLWGCGQFCAAAARCGIPALQGVLPVSQDSILTAPVHRENGNLDSITVGFVSGGGGPVSKPRL